MIDFPNAKIKVVCDVKKKLHDGMTQYIKRQVETSAKIKSDGNVIGSYVYNYDYDINRCFNNKHTITTTIGNKTKETQKLESIVGGEMKEDTICRKTPEYQSQREAYLGLIDYQTDWFTYHNSGCRSYNEKGHPYFCLRSNTHTLELSENLPMDKVNAIIAGTEQLPGTTKSEAKRIIQLIKEALDTNTRKLKKEILN